MQADASEFHSKESALVSNFSKDKNTIDAMLFWVEVLGLTNDGAGATSSGKC